MRIHVDKPDKQSASNLKPPAPMNQNRSTTLSLFSRISSWLFILLLLPLCSFSQGRDLELMQNLVEYSKTSAVTGREQEASAYLQSLLPKVPFKKDKLGNLYVVFGSGSPRKLIATPLDEPGYVVSEIRDNGYLRVTPVGGGHEGNLFHQFLEGHEIVIQTEDGPVIGVSTVPSSHYEGLRQIRESSKDPFTWQEAFLDIGESSSQAVAKRNVKYLDPVTYHKKVSVINNQWIAAPSVKSKAAAVALAAVINNMAEAKVKGTTVIAFTTLELINGKGLEAIINQVGPFDEIHKFNRFLDSDQVGTATLLTNNTAYGKDKKFVNVEPIGRGRTSSSTLDITSLKVYEVGLPARYASTPVEMVAISDVENLIDHWMQVIGVSKKQKMPRAIPISIKLPSYNSFTEEHAAVSALVSKYGVSEDEKQVRDFILSQLPSWAKPTVDGKGNIILNFGQGQDQLVFVAHMDETGYFVEDIQDDGRLVLKSRGGMLPWIWEAQPALIHVSEKPIQGIFEPRKDYREAKERALSNPLIVFAGFNSKTEALVAGIKPGTTTVTMPKGMIRLSENRATARGFDDRVGCAALLLSLKELNPGQLKQKVTFIWAVEEEIGLRGSTFASKNLTQIKTVYPIDTFVSSDDPYDVERFANCPLGNGAVIRVLESINFVSRENLSRVQDIASNSNVKVQYGMTAGGTDGQAFLGYGIPSIPLSWPGRYSHSPVELMDYRDMHNLVLLINAIMNKTE